MDLIRAAAMIDTAYTEKPADPQPEERTNGDMWRPKLDPLTDTPGSVEVYRKVLEAIGEANPRDVLCVIDKLMMLIGTELAGRPPLELMRILLRDAREKAAPHLAGEQLEIQPILLSHMILRGLMQAMDRDEGFVPEYVRVEQERVERGE